MSTIWQRYAARVSQLPTLRVKYFGLTRDGWHSFDVYGTPPGCPERLIGIVKRRDGSSAIYKAWRNGHCAPRADTLRGSVNWIVSRAAESGEVLFP